MNRSVPPDTSELDAAYAACQRLATRHYENFPVASRLLPSRMRPYVAAVYAFARPADDFADEGEHRPAERQAWLDDWQRRLDGCVDGPARRILPAAKAPMSSSLADAAPDLIFLALGDTIRSCRLPKRLFDDLLSAFRQDVTTDRYDSWDDLMDYCRRSANPVGRLILGIASATGNLASEAYTASRMRSSGAEGQGPETEDRGPATQDFFPSEVGRRADRFCTALQLTNFWQDLERDWQRGRLYVPRSLSDRFGAEEADLGRRVLSPAWRLALGAAARCTREYFDDGRPICALAHGRLRFELRLTWLGGMSILHRLESCQFDVFRRRPTLKLRHLPSLVARALAWREATTVRSAEFGMRSE